MAQLYDRTDIYDLIDSEERYLSIKKHWEKVLEGKEVKTLLDVSIGTGSLTLPAAELGVSLYGSDLSGAMLDKCGMKAEAKGMSVNLRKSDFRELTQNFTEQFDCVASTGNSLPYVANEEIPSVLRQMDALVAEGGFLYFDMRNWDKILRERNRFYLYDPFFDGNTRINLIQVWDYPDDDSMIFHLLYTFEKDNHIFQKEKFEEHYYPVSRKLLLGELETLGYRNIKVMNHPAFITDVDVDETDWYCVMARK